MQLPRPKKLLILLVPVYFLYLVGLYFTQESLIFMPSQKEWMTLDSTQVEVDEFTLHPEEGVSIHGYFVRVPEAERTILFFHGNGGNVTANFGRIEMARQMKYNIALFDYRGYGKSTGKISKEEDLYTDSKVVYDYVVNKQKVEPRNLVFWGQSLGGAVATEMAKRYWVNALIIESSFTSVRAIMNPVLRYTVPSFLLKYKFETIKKLKNMRSVVVILHSREDEMIPFSNAEKLYEIAPKPKKLIEMTGAHNEGFWENYQKYIEIIMDYLG